MITKFTPTGYAPFAITTVNSYAYARVDNLCANTLYISLDGTANVTTPTGVNPGIPVTSGAPLVYAVDDRRMTLGKPIYGCFDSAAISTGVCQSIGGQ